MRDWNTACPDWAERLMSGRSPIPDLPLFENEAERALRIFRRLRVPDMVGLPRMGDVAGPWLFPLVAAIFGSYDVETNERMLSEFFVLVPKKNGKTSTAAAVMVEALILNRRPEAEFILVAPTKEVADISFRQAAGTIRADPELSKLFHTQNHVKTIQHLRNGATLKVKAADTDVVTGGKQVGTLIDELHVLSSKSEAADILTELRGSLAARPDGFLITITTQSKDPPAGVFKDELAKARAVRDGELRLPILPVLYEPPPQIAKIEQMRERKNWGIVNPNLGRSVSEKFLTEQLAAADKSGIHSLALFASQHFNIEVGVGLHTDAWVGAEYWEQCADPTLTLDSLLARSDVAVVGVDGGGVADLFGLAVLGRERSDEDIRFRRWFLWTHSWAHKSVLTRYPEISPRLQDFAAVGELTLYDDMDDDLADIVETIGKVKDSGLLSQIGMDAHGIGTLVDALRDADIETREEGMEIIKSIPQGYKMMSAIKTAERKLVAGTLIHGGQSIMNWCVGNAKVEPKGNAVMITKQISGYAKIDPLMAMFDAVAIMSMNPAPAHVVPEIFAL